MSSSAAPQARWAGRVAATTSAVLIAAGLWGAAPASATACVFAQGDGSVGDPYRVATRDDLEQVEICPDKAFLQTADISLSVGGAWVPLAAPSPFFTGTYDGGSHTISNMTTDTGAANRGLFAKSDGATIKNLSLTSATVAGGNTNGALVAEPVNTDIADVTVTGLVVGGTNVGGVVGNASQGTTLTRISFSGTVAGAGDTGGVAGTLANASATDIEVTGTRVSGTNDAGGLVGSATDSTIARVSVAATIQGEDAVGGVAGRLANTPLSESTANIVISATGNVGGLVGANDAGTISQVSAEGTLDGVGSLGGVVGTSDGGELHDVSTAVAVTGTDDTVGGMAGSLNQTIVTGASATGVVSAPEITGGLVGFAGGLVTITDSQASGDVDGGRFAGGLVGQAGSGWSISLSTATGDVTGSAYVGGLLGRGNGGGTISQSGATGNVTADDVYVGGLVGVAEDTTIEESFATGDVSGTENVGGLVGLLTARNTDFEINNSYATGAVSANDAGGGLIGSAYLDMGTVRVTNSYAAGAVTVSGAASGGLIGAPSGGDVVTESFWNSTVNPTLVGGEGTPKTTGELRAKATFADAGWAIQTGGGAPVGSNVWGICVPPVLTLNSGYPFLLWQSEEDPCPSVPAAPTLQPLTIGDTTLGVTAQLGDDGGLPITDVQYRLDDGAWTSSGQTTGAFTIGDLTNGTTYRVRVRSVNELGTSDPSNEQSGTPTAAPDPTPTPTPTPTPETTLVVKARPGGKALTVDRRTVLVRNVRTNGTLTSVRATCTVKGQRLPKRIRAELCGLRVVAPNQSATVSAAAKKKVKVSAKPTCSRGLRIQVRITAKATGAERKVFSRNYRADRTAGVTCRIKGTG